MKATEIVNSVKELLHLSKKDVNIKDVIEEEAVELSTEEVVEAIEEEVKEVILAEESKEGVAEAPVANYATSEDLSQVKQELLSMIKQLIEDKSSTKEADVPAELSAIEKEAVELSEEVVEEIVHSPESGTERKKSLLSNKRPMTTAQRVAWMINN
tara:strand:+ start:77 stop:544 length:468 start_codon:yes stop_codon:yes gene_type:complete